MNWLPYLHTVWCDDVRSELLNKLTVVGVYTGQAVFPARPAAFLKLCAWASFHWPIDEPWSDLRIVARRNDGVEIVSALVPPKSEAPAGLVQEGMTTYVIQVVLTLQQLVLPDDCKFLEVVVLTPDGTEYKSPQKLWILVDEKVAASIGIPN